MMLRSWIVALAMGAAGIGTVAFPGEPLRFDWSRAGRLGSKDGGVPASKDAGQPTADGESLSVAIPRSTARPGDRWIEAELTLRPRKEPLSGLRVAVSLFALGADRPAATLSATPPAEQSKAAGPQPMRATARLSIDAESQPTAIQQCKAAGPQPMRATARLSIDAESQPTAIRQCKLLADLRTLRLKTARLRVELLAGDRRLAVWEALVTAQDPATPLAPGTRIPVTVDTPPGVAVRNYPVTFGVPFPAGVLWDVAALRLVNGDGREVPAQTEVTGRCAPDGAIRWVRCDALVTSGEKYFVEVGGPAATRPPTPALTLASAGGKITLDTGAARYVLGTGRSPIQEVWMNGSRVAWAGAPTSRGLYAVDQKGRVGYASADGEKVDIERAGPIAACVRFEGFYTTAEGVNLARHITRVEAFAGQPFARVTHTLVLTNNTNEVWFKEIGWELAASPGERPQAVFGTSREDFNKAQTLPVPTGAALWMLQDQHYRFGAGKSHFVVSQALAGKQTQLAEGEECGDYAALIGSAGGLMMACKEAARQHPKEFEIAAGTINLRLFSGRAGEELDFRMPTLVKKWNLAEWVEKGVSSFRRRQAGPDALAKIAKYPSDAAGWAKTHDLLIAPVAAAPAAAEMARLNRDRVFAQAAPAWLCASGTFDRIHPRDPERFPREERLIDGTVDVWYQRMYGAWGLFGFVDYNAGPVLDYFDGEVPRLYRFVRYTYSLRSDLWLQYARSGDRRTREFAAATNRAYVDNVYSHWDYKKKVAGLPVGSGDGDEYPAKGSLPMYWGESAQTNFSSSSNLNQIAWDYYLTGSGRARDQMLEYAQGIKKLWTPEIARRDWRQLMLMRLLIQCYQFTWDPELLALARATTDTFYDPEGELLLSKNRPYHSSTYKTQVDVAALLDAWRITGERRYYDMAFQVSHYWWKTLLGAWPIFYFNPQGRIGQFLYDETVDPSYPQGLLIQMRQAATACDPQTGQVIGKQDGRIGAEDASFVFSGIPFAQEVVVRSGVDRAPTAAWVGWDDFGSDTCLYALKEDTQSLCVQMKTSGARGGATKIDIAEGANSGGGDLFYAKEQGGGEATFHVSKDAPAGCYRLTSGHLGEHFALANRSAKLVLYAPGFWQPRPKLAPAARWYFTIPADARNAQIYFDGPAMIYDPAGKPLSDKPLPSGWTDLSAGRAGLWSFETLGAKLVCVHNLPPVFAAGDPDSFFMPPVEWMKDAPPMAVQLVPAGTTFIPGAGADPTNKAIYVDANRTFLLDGGPPRPDGQGTQFLPFPQGTIECFVKATWDVADLPDATGYLVRLIAAPEDWTLGYMKNSKSDSWMASHCLYGYFMTDGKGGRKSMRDYRRTVFPPGQWVHVAWVWGPKQYSSMVERNRGPGVTTAIYVNGRAAQQYTYIGAGCLPSDLPRSLLLLNVMNKAKDKGTAYDELRVSDVMRYSGDFTPPPADQRLKLDEHTRALFHFDGTLDGETASPPGKVTGRFSRR
jgi:hypothetical protein